jgi:hypothetical protein
MKALLKISSLAGLMLLAAICSAEAGSISGKTFVQETSAALAGVTVRAQKIEGTDSGSAVTDASGNFTISGLPGGFYYITAKKASYGIAYKSGILVGDAAGQNLYLTNNPGWISGTVTDSAANPLNGVTVVLQIRDPNYYYRWLMISSAQSNALGQYTLADITPASSLYIVRPAGATIGAKSYAGKPQTDISVAAGAGTTVSVVMQEAVKIKGKVTEAATGNPVSGVYLECYAQNEEGFGGSDNSDTNGDYEIPYLYPGKYYTVRALPAIATGYVIAQNYVDAANPGEYTVNFPLQSGAIKVSGSITIKSTGRPQSGITVNYYQDFSNINAYTTSDTDGNYVLSNLPTGKARVNIQPASVYGWDGVEQDFQADSIVDFQLVPEGKISGLVRDANTKLPIPGLSLKVNCWNDNKRFGKSTYTNATDGTFNINGLAKGLNELTIRPTAESGYAWRQKYIYLDQGQSRANIDLLLMKGALVTGHAKEALTNAPVPNILIESSGIIEGWWGNTDGAGNFYARLAGGSPDSPQNYEFAIDEDHTPWAALPQRVTINGPTDDKNLEFLAYNYASITSTSGMILNPGGYPKSPDAVFMVAAFPAGTPVNKDTLRYSEPLTFAARQDPGAYELKLAPGANYDLYFVMADQENDYFSVTGRSVVKNAPQASTGNNFTYDSEGGTLNVRVKCNKQPLLQAETYLEDLAGNFAGYCDTNYKGECKFNNVPAGNYQISAWHADYGFIPPAPISALAEGGTAQADILFSKVDLAPLYGSSLPGQAVVFNAVYSDPHGWADVKNAQILVNTSTNGKNSFYGHYDQNVNKLYLRNDTNTAWIGGFAPGSANVIENSFVKLNCAQTTVAGMENNLNVQWAVVFKDGFTAAQTKKSYLRLVDDSNIYSGWLFKGTWLVGPNSVPAPVSVSPNFGCGPTEVAKTFIAIYADPNGFRDFKDARLLIDTDLDKKNCFYGLYNQNTNMLYLRDDANTAWLGGFTPGSANVIENSYARLDCSKTRVSGSLNNLTVKWNIIFKSAFAAAKTNNIYLYATDDSNAYCAWANKGSWLVGANSAPVAETITPASGASNAGQQVSFTTTYTDPNGYADLKENRLLINTSTSSSNCAPLYYDQNSNKLYLRNDTNTAWLGGYAPTSANVIENSYAKLDCSKTTVSGAGTKLTVKWSVIFKSGFSGAKKTYLYAKDDSNAASGWIQKGSWTINP